MATKHLLQSLLENASLDVTSYSGRGMYGKECLGVTIGSIGEFMTSYTMALFGYYDELNGAHDEVVGAVQCLRIDSLGMGIIVYFPNVPFTDEEEDDLEDEG